MKKNCSFSAATPSASSTSSRIAREQETANYRLHNYRARIDVFWLPVHPVRKWMHRMQNTFLDVLRFAILCKAKGRHALIGGVDSQAPSR